MLASTRVAAQGRPPRKIGLLMPTSADPHFWNALKERLAAFASIAKEQTGAVIVLSDPFLVGQRDKIGSLAQAQKIPVFAQVPEHVRAGALMSYGPDYVEHFRRAAYFVDRILKGAKPGDLPIEQAATFALVVNRKTAAALGIKIPRRSCCVRPR